MSKNKITGSTDRRTFLKASSLAAGSLIVPAWLSAKAFSSSDDAIRIGVIGCGGRGSGAVVQALSTSQNVKLVAMADAFRDRLDSCYENASKQTYRDAKGREIPTGERIDVPEEHKFVGFDGFSKVIPLVDVVILTTPPAFRPVHFEAAIEAGKHVFMEKPVATDSPGIRQVLATAQKAKDKKLNVVVGLQRHYQDKYTEWVQRMHDGAIGDILTSRVYWNSGGVWVKERQPEQSELEYQMRNWYYFTWVCGDHILEQHIHNLDVSNWVKQAYPTEAYGMGGRRMRTGPDHGQIFDHHYVEYSYEDGSRMISQCRHWQNTPSRVTEGFHGTKGSAPEPGKILSADGSRLFQYREKTPPNPST